MSAGGAWRASVLPPAFSCSSTSSGLDAAWVHVAGELDIATVPELEVELRTQARLVVLDLREVEFLESSSVHAIVDESLRARQESRRLVLLRSSANIDRTFRLTGSFQDVEIGELDPAEPPVQVLLKLAQENLVKLSVTNTPAGGTVVGTTASDFSIALGECQGA